MILKITCEDCSTLEQRTETCCSRMSQLQLTLCSVTRPDVWASVNGKRFESRKWSKDRAVNSHANSHGHSIAQTRPYNLISSITWQLNGSRLQGFDIFAWNLPQRRSQNTSRPVVCHYAVIAVYWRPRAVAGCSAKLFQDSPYSVFKTKRTQRAFFWSLGMGRLVWWATSLVLTV